MSTNPGPVLGPCETWITGDDVAACYDCSPVGGTGILDTVAVEASMVLYELSGRQFSGSCEKVVRPCRDSCGCWGGSRALGFSWAWTVGGPWGAWWVNECGHGCGCHPDSFVKLAGYPVTEIVEVLIDGDVVDPDSYRLDGWRKLTRLDDPGPPVKRRFWPSCQNMSLNADQPGTFQVTYRHGVAAPPIGRDAAAELAYQLYLTCGEGAACAVPEGVTKIERQGITIDRVALGSWLDPDKGSTGLAKVDTFLAAYWRKGRMRRPAVWSPDGPRYARRVGS